MVTNLQFNTKTVQNTQCKQIKTCIKTTTEITLAQLLHKSSVDKVMGARHLNNIIIIMNT